ncbi:hypothetical protein DICVIV_10576 [Dictyocaulus viviparus]|uniref:Uncharacterized protein n=1 Tax=Dictyocaulus viviparus TaxID=29172 RepID=A0A0D8XI07_DICVI|nr:hypothetical protein DICVIV_10576 [Dictyocaulus viviparus]
MKYQGALQGRNLRKKYVYKKIQFIKSHRKKKKCKQIKGKEKKLLSAILREMLQPSQLSLEHILFIRLNQTNINFNCSTNHLLDEKKGQNFRRYKEFNERKNLTD